MGRKKIAVFGASGFVGSALCERLFFEGEYPFVALIHKFGGAERIARFPIEIAPVDILGYSEVLNVLKGCEIVINCSRGDSRVMLNGLKNIIRAAKETNIRKFIHLSSVAIYGDDPPTESGDERCVPDPKGNLYGVEKLEQDKLVLELHKSGIDSIILCPSNIIGPYSGFCINVLERLLSKKIVLVDSGQYPCNLIHVDNLVEAMLLVLKNDAGWGERYFINGKERTTWREFYEAIAKKVGLANYEFRSVTREEVIGALESNGRSQNLRDLFKLLLSGEFRRNLCRVELFKRANDMASNMFYNLSPSFQRYLRRKLERPIVIEKSPDFDLKDQYIKVQIRRVYHSPEKAMKTFGYNPLLNFGEGMETIKSWLKFANLIQIGEGGNGLEEWGNIYVLVSGG